MVCSILIKLFRDNLSFYWLPDIPFPLWAIIQNAIKNVIFLYPLNTILPFISWNFICNIRSINPMSNGLTSSQLNGGIKLVLLILRLHFGGFYSFFFLYSMLYRLPSHIDRRVSVIVLFTFNWVPLRILFSKFLPS